MIRKTAALLVLAICTMSYGQQSSEVNPKNSWLDGFEPKSYSLRVDHRSQYVLSNAVLAYDDDVIQPDLFMVWKNGLTFDIWASAPVSLGDFNENFGTELDLTLGWIDKAGDYTISAGAAYYDLYRVGSIEGGDILCAYGEISRDFQPLQNLTLSPFARIEVNFTPNGDCGSDALPRIGSRYALKLSDVFTVSGKAMVVYDPGILGLDTALIGNVEASLLWKLGKHTVLELPYLKMVSPLTDVEDVRKTRYVYGASINFLF